MEICYFIQCLVSQAKIFCHCTYENNYKLTKPSVKQKGKIVKVFQCKPIYLFSNCLKYKNLEKSKIVLIKNNFRMMSNISKIKKCFINCFLIKLKIECTAVKTGYQCSSLPRQSEG